MKKYILIALVLMSCNKDKVVDRTVDTPSYVGTYTSIGGDTAYVSITDVIGMINIKWCALGNAAKINFDSTMVFEDRSFTDNQLVDYFGMKTAIGSGNFGTNTTTFHFVVDGTGVINFDGIKKTP